MADSLVQNNDIYVMRYICLNPDFKDRSIILFEKDPKIFLYESSKRFLDYIVHCFVICKNTAAGGKYWVF